MPDTFHKTCGAKKLKPGPKPRDPAITLRRKARARLLRIDPDMAVAVAPFVEATRAERAVAPGPVESTHAPPVRPPWPSYGYVGGPNVRTLQKHEHQFIRELAAPVDLEAKLAQATGYAPVRLSCREIDHVLTAFVADMRATVEERLATFTEAERMFRRDGAEAIAARLDRLRWEADGYIDRLSTARILLVQRLEDRERQERERACAMTEAIIGARARVVESRAASAPPRDSGPHSIAPWATRRR